MPTKRRIGGNTSNAGGRPRPRRRTTTRPPRWLRSQRRRSDKRSFWNWLPIPIAAALITATFGLWQFYLNNLQHHHDQLAALDQQRATILQTYIDDTRDLLLTHKLAESTPGDEVRQVARVQTLTTLRSLNADRNKTVLRFLYDAHLIGMPDAIINLRYADLSGADLKGAMLSGIDLTGADLSRADLSSADLSSADLSSADLSRADLSRAD